VKPVEEAFLAIAAMKPPAELAGSFEQGVMYGCILISRLSIVPLVMV
jgi:hypothetical protein